MGTHPRIVVLGGPVPEELRDALADNIDIVAEADLGDGDYNAILVHARAGSLAAVRRFREAGGNVPIYGYSPDPVTIHQRLAWIREGADDLLHTDPAVQALIRRMRGPAPRPAPTQPTMPVAMRLDRYLLALDQYLASRTDLIRRLGEDGAQRYVACVSRREQVCRAADGDLEVDPLAERRGSTREELNWSVRVLDDPDINVELLDVSADGLRILLDAEPVEGEPLRLGIEGLTVAADVDVEVRWSRPRPPRGWEAGTWAARTTITRSP